MVQNLNVGKAQWRFYQQLDIVTEEFYSRSHGNSIEVVFKTKTDNFVVIPIQCASGGQEMFVAQRNRLNVDTLSPVFRRQIDAVTG